MKFQRGRAPIVLKYSPTLRGASENGLSGKFSSSTISRMSDKAKRAYVLLCKLAETYPIVAGDASFTEAETIILSMFDQASAEPAHESAAERLADRS